MSDAAGLFLILARNSVTGWGLCHQAPVKRATGNSDTTPAGNIPTGVSFTDISEALGKQMSTLSDVFVGRWVNDNVLFEAGAPDPASAVARLKNEVLIDAAERGINESELVDTMGDITEYLREAYDWMRNPDTCGLGNIAR
jgi:hypothetical protein